MVQTQTIVMKGPTEDREDLTNCLPDDIWIYILSFLGKSILCRLSILNSRWRDFAYDFSLWKSHFMSMKNVKHELVVHRAFLPGEDVDWREEIRKLLSGTYTWHVPDFSSKVDRFFSPPFLAVGCWWDILLYPSGNATPHVSIYLRVDQRVPLPPLWVKKVEFGITLISKYPVLNISKYAPHTFNAEEDDWGFTHLISLPNLRDKTLGFLPNDTLSIRVDIWNVSALNNGSSSSKLPPHEII